MKKITALILSAAILISLLAGCNRNTAEESGEVAENPAEETQMDNDNTPNTEPINYTGTVSGFSSRLFLEILKAEEENPVISPLSIFMALSMAASGAEGTTLEEFEDVLGMDRDTLNQANRQIQDSLSEISGSTTLELANSMWADSTKVNPKESFANGLKDIYNADLFTRDFVSPEIENEMNEWINGKTHGLIPKLVDRINEETVMMLINTLYMKSMWQIVFDPDKTTDKEFTTASGEIVETEFLVGNSQMHSYIRDGNLEGTVLPYDDGRLAFVALKTTDGSSIRDSFDIETLDINDFISKAEEREPVILSMPRFEAEYDIDLQDITKQMGILTAFDGEEADFSSIDQGIHMSMILHKVNVRVDEDGTEAAASTAIGFDTTSIQLEEDDILYLTFDSPYLYAIVDLDTGLPLFMGIMENPTA